MRKFGQYLVISTLLANGIFSETPAAESTDLRKALITPPPDCATVAENAARFILQGEDKKSYIAAEWRKLCPASEGYLLFELSDQLGSGAGKVGADAALYKKMHRPAHLLAGVSASGHWARLVSQTASAATPADDDAKAIQRWLTAGSHAAMQLIGQSRNSRLHIFYREEQRARESQLHFVMGINAGAWIPQGNLGRLGSHPAIGYYFGAAFDRLTFTLDFDFRFGGTLNTYQFYNSNSGRLENTNTFFGLYLGPGMRYEFAQLHDFSFFVTGGLGYDLITHYAAPRYSGQRPVYSDSLSANLGLLVRWYLNTSRTGYLEAGGRYHFVSMGEAGSGGDNLSGNYVTIGAAAGYRIMFDE